MRKIILLLLICSPLYSQAQFTYDLQGHRGARGLMPENTIPSMIKALELGATRLELDLAVTEDGEVILSHEPYMNPVICLDPNGNEIPKSDKSHNIYQMSYREVLAYDCGTKFHADFPKQLKFHVTKPKLADVFLQIDQYAENFGYPKPHYNIEIKSSPEGDGIYHPGVKEFSDRVVELISHTIGLNRVNLQSFDFRVIQYIHNTFPEVQLAMLVSNPAGYESQLAELGFQPEIYSPYFPQLTAEIVSALHQKGMKVVPWTVNTPEQMNKLLDMGVDGIITDFPNLAPQR
jgi:glycerophosphoryl diester phosphodiesterase